MTEERASAGLTNRGEMTANERRAAIRASQKEWDWDHPWCEVCEVQHLPDEHTEAWDAYHAALDAEDGP